jgi:putative PIN family toxin of toxin-antitoxin system
MRLVLDTSVLVAAIRSDQGASHQLLLGALQDRFQMIASVPLMIEYQAVMTRQEHLEASGLTYEEVNELLDAIADVVSPVVLDYLWRPILRDPDDDMVLETAVNGRADAIVTLNTRDFRGVPKQFGVKIWLPKDGLKVVKE